MLSGKGLQFDIKKVVQILNPNFPGETHGKESVGPCIRAQFIFFFNGGGINRRLLLGCKGLKGHSH